MLLAFGWNVKRPVREADPSPPTNVILTPAVAATLVFCSVMKFCTVDADAVQVELPVKDGAGKMRPLGRVVLWLNTPALY